MSRNFPELYVRNVAARAYDFGGSHQRQWVDLTPDQQQHYADFADEVLRRGERAAAPAKAVTVFDQAARNLAQRGGDEATLRAADFVAAWNAAYAPGTEV